MVLLPTGGMGKRRLISSSLTGFAHQRGQTPYER